MLDYFLRYIRSKNGKKLVLGTTVIDCYKLEATNLLLAMLHIDETPGI